MNTNQTHTTPMGNFVRILCGVAVGLLPLLIFAFTLLYFGDPVFNMVTIGGYCAMLIVGVLLLIGVGILPVSSSRRNGRDTSRH